MRDSQYGEEWSKAQAEISAAQEQISHMTASNGDLTRALNEKLALVDQVTRELNSLREQATHEKQAHQREAEALRADKRLREEMFRNLVTGLKDVVVSVQRELELKDLDLSSIRGVGAGADRNKAIKDELELIKRTILDKIKTERDELKVRERERESNNQVSPTHPIPTTPDHY